MRLGDKLKRNFARNLQRLREGRGLSQMALAEQLNEKYNHQIQLKRTAIANYEAEEAMPRIDALHCMADYFERSIDDMLRGEDGRAVLEPIWQPLADRGSLPKNTDCSNTAAKETVTHTNVDEISHMCRVVAEKTAIHHFYLELTKNFLGHLRATAGGEEEQKRIDQLFHKTYLGCLIGKMKIMEDRVKVALTVEEEQVFMAFLEPETNLTIVANGLGMEERAVLAIFQQAQEKLAQAIGRNTKL